MDPHILTWQSLMQSSRSETITEYAPILKSGIFCLSVGSAASFRSYWITWSSLCDHHHSEKQKGRWTNDHHNLIVKCVVLQVSQAETPFTCLLAHTVLKQRQQRWKNSKFDNKTSLITGWHHGTIIYLALYRLHVINSMLMFKIKMVLC